MKKTLISTTLLTLLATTGLSAGMAGAAPESMLKLMLPYYSPKKAIL
ncbi:hypothetical protein [Latilactobacillus curvatus]